MPCSTKDRFHICRVCEFIGHSIVSPMLSARFSPIIHQYLLPAHFCRNNRSIEQVPQMRSTAYGHGMDQLNSNHLGHNAVDKDIF